MASGAFGRVSILATTSDSTSTDTSTTATDTTAPTTTTSTTTTPAPTYSPTISSDQADYSPGSTVTLTGTGWAPLDAVHIFVNDNEGQTWSYSTDVTVDAAGALRLQFQLPMTFVATYVVTATGTISGTATTSFTDGNVTLHLAASEGVSSMTVGWARFDGRDAPGGINNDCSGTASATGTLTIASGATANIPGFGGSKDSARLTSVTSATPGKTFDRWSSGTPSADSGTTIPGSPTPCISNGTGTNGNVTDGYAHFVNSNHAPAIARNNASVTVSEGATAANTGTWSDADSGDTVTLSASVGTVTKSGTNASGTWSWSFGTSDGPTQSQTVTITANDGNGGVNTTTFSLVVNNVTPIVTAPANQTATATIPSSFALGSFTDPGADSPWTVTVNWGDGGPNTVFTQGATGTITGQVHTYATPGSFTVAVTVKDKDNATSGAVTFTVNVSPNNHAPTANAGGPYSGDEGSAIQLDGSGSSDPDAGDTLTYAWSANAGAPCSFSSTTAQKPTITCTDNGSFTVSLTVTDNHGASSATASTAALNVANVAPTATFSNNGPVNEVQSFQLSLTGTTDPSSTDTTAGFQYAFDCGDGSGYGAFGASNSRTCSTTDNGVRSVKGKVKDKDGGVNEYTGSVTVNNVAPSITSVSNDGPIDEGGSATITVTASDPAGAADPLSYEFDCDNNGIYEVGPQAGNSHYCSFSNNGSKQVNVRVTDDDGGATTGFTAVTVKNVAPTITSVTNNGPIDEGGSATITVTATDPADTVSFEFDCDNNGTYEVGPQAGNTHACSFSDDGSKQVNVRVSDGDDTTTGATTVTVHNVAPTATFSNDGPVDEGSSFHLSLTGASDPSSADTAAGFHYAFDCGGGSGYGAFGTSNTDTCTTNDDGVRTVKGKIQDKDGGVSEYTTSVTVKNVPPTITSITNNGPIDEGGSATISVTATDPADTLSYEFDCNNDNSYEVGPQTSDTHACSFDDDGAKQVNVRVSDGDGGSATGSMTVSVHNVAPTASFSNDGPVDEGSSFHLSLTGASDPSAADTAAGFQYAFDCGGGSGYGGFGTSNTDTCTTNDDGVRTVKGKIRDKDGGVSEYTDSVTVKNVPPTVTAPGDQASAEGSSTSFGLGSFSDPGPDSPWAVTVDWGDGSPTSTPPDKTSTGSLGSASHTYDDNGSYTVKVTVTDKDGASGSTTFKANVSNVPPTASLGNNGAVDEGSPATISFSGHSDPSSADTTAGFHYSYACDGMASSLATTYAGATDGASKQCTFADNGSYGVKGRIFDKDGGSSTYDTTVHVNNVNPSLTPPSDDTGLEGASKSFGLGSFSDPGANDNPWHLHVTWGDGSAAYDHDYSSAGALGMAPHAYDDNGTYTVTETITDKDGGSDTQTFKVTIDNVAPTAALGNNGPVDEGSPATISFSGQHDPSSADTAAGFHYAYDCNGGSLAGATYSGSGSSPTKQCTYADNGTYTVSGRIIDKDNGSTEYTTNVVVRNVVPTVTPPANQTADEGSSTNFGLGSFGDPGPDSPWSVDVNWGDGSAHTTFNETSTGSLGSQAHTYADNGNYTVTVTVKDKDNGSGSATFVATVGNIPPTITSFNATGTPSFIGPLVFMPATFSGAFTDPGTLDSGTIGWKWDGVADSSATQSYPASQRSFSQTHTYASAGCNHTATVRVTDKDSGFAEATTTVGVGTGAFLPPMTNQPVTNKLKNGQVLPVKIQLTDCNGAGVNGLTPAIRLIEGDQTQVPDDSAVPITPGSASNADNTGVMRSNGTDGSYIYNMMVSLTRLNTDYTVVIYPYWTSGTPSGPTLRHVIQATR
jgi:hypothetical protein